jgi:hypothetical protein
MQPADPIKPPLKFRKLRIAWSLFWVIACVLLIMLWVRSYSRQVAICIRLPGYRIVDSISWDGWSSLDYDSETPNEFSDLSDSRKSELGFYSVSGPKAGLAPGRGWKWASYRDNTMMVVQTRMPCWFTTFVAVAFASLPWICHLRWRFSYVGACQV